MSNKILWIFVLTLLVLTTNVFAADLRAYSVSEENNLCPGSTGLFVDAIENLGSENAQVSISTTGSASSYSTSVPQGLTLKPGQIKFIYTYVTPRSTTPVGSYSLQVNTDSERISHNIQVNDCFSYEFTSSDSINNICPGEQTQFNYQVSNTGEFTDTYFTSLEGPYANKVTLSDSQFSLNPGQSKTITTTVQSSPEDKGEKEFTVVVDPNLGRNIKTIRSKVNLDICYDFQVNSESNLATMCENSEDMIPIEITNTGSTDNKFTLDITGPAWANLNNNVVSVPARSSKTVNLILSPNYGVEGNFRVNIVTKPEKGQVQATSTFNVNVNKCHDVSVLIARDSDVICNSLENTYEVKVTNNGQFDKDFDLEISGPEWASLPKRSVSLNKGEEESIDLSINPPFNTVPGSYKIEILTTAKDASRVFDSDSIQITTVSREECYQSKIDLTDNKLEVPYDSSATIPISIENIGSNTATYELGVSGSAANFVYLNPGVIEVEGGKSEIVYLYVAPTSQVSNGRYQVTITTKLEDSTILASENLNIDVTESKVIKSEDSPDNVVTGSFWNSITGFFSSIFSFGSDEVEDISLKENETDHNDSDEMIDDDLMEGNETIEETTEDDSQNDSIVEETEEDKENDAMEDEVVSESEDDTMEETSSSEDKTVSQTTGFAAALSNSYNSLLDFTVEQRTIIIIVLVIIILILLAIKTGFHKKIINFFEEEIEEEQSKLEDSKQEQTKLEQKEPPAVRDKKPEKKETNKEDKKKEKSKKEVKSKEEDDDEVIIEFDDD